MKRKSRVELEESRSNWRFWCIGFIVIFTFLLIFSIIDDNNLIKIESQLAECQEDIPLAEVINGNLYVGYENGVRVGFHQDYNDTWYRCVRECEVIE